MLDLDGFNALVKTATGLGVVFDEGQDVETPQMPYISANLIDEKRYKGHQVMSETTVVGPNVEKRYACPVETSFQYGAVYAADQFPEARAKIRELYMYLLTDKFKLAMKRLDDVSMQITSAIRETKILKGDIFERRLTFDVVFHWTDYYVDSTSDVIDTAELEGEVVTGGL